MKKNKENKKKLGLFYVLKNIFPTIFKANPAAFIVMALGFVVSASGATVIMHLNRNLYDKVASLIGGNAAFAAVLPALLAVVGGKIVLDLFRTGQFMFIDLGYFESNAVKLRSTIHKKLGRIDPILYEDKDFNDTVEKADQGVYAALGYLNSVTSIVFYCIPYLLIMSWYLFTIKPIFVVMIVLIFVPAFLVKLSQIKVHAHMEDTVAPYRRAMNYYEDVLTKPKHFKETRILGAGLFFRTLYETVQAIFIKTEWKVIRKVKLTFFYGRLVTLLGYVGVLWLLVDSLLAGEISVGAFAAVFTSIESVFWTVSQIADESSGLVENAGRVSNYIEFLKLEERGGEVGEIADGEIVLQNVSFSYPGREEKALDNLSLRIKSGETVAIVGANGAGKSTLVRLMSGIYLPNEGSVTVGGLDTAKYTPSSIRERMSAVFQKFNRYKLPLRENIAISQGKLQGDDGRITAACADAGVEYSSEVYPKGLDTMLAKEYDGIELSGGQWQRVAIARGLYRNHDIIMLDEPTAAIDPLEESRLYSGFAELSKGKTSVLVTHRLGSARIADRIVVMEKGRIVESGTHDELIKAKGAYAEMFDSQAKWYA
ncbi:MAG: ABC transporter ATP-binding protein [Clostridia bacterium]|nr:ABC transporter ATP-binding protein [Clostridia bacterium]